MYAQLLPTLVDFFQWPTPLFLVLGTAVGILFGLLPGLGGPQALALLLPIAVALPDSAAIALLLGAMGSIPVSGSITAILINTPGTAQSAATTFDGFPLTLQGKGGLAIGATCMSGLLGAVFGAIVLTLVLPFGRAIVLSFSYPEYFMLAVLGLSLIATVIQGSALKGLVAAALGLLLASIGINSTTGAIRYTFGWNYLYDGIGLVPALVGLFAIAEAVYLFERKGALTEPGTNAGVGTGVREGINSVFRHFWMFLRCSVIGTLVGIVPGVGGSVSNFLAYGHVVQTARDRSRFGKGDIRGVIAPEAANNAKDGGALIPTLIFGIPGSIETAILLGGLTLFGLDPGPRLILDHPAEVATVIYALVGTNILTSVACLVIGGPLTRVTTIPARLLAVVIGVVSLLGVYAANGLIEDDIIAIAFGAVGFLLRRFGFPLVPLVLGLVLGNLMETSLNQTLATGGLTEVVTRPISLGLLIVTIVALVGIPLGKRLRERKAIDGDETRRTTRV